MVGIAVDAGAVTAVSIGEGGCCFREMAIEVAIGETICTGNRHLCRILGIGCGMACGISDTRQKN